MQKTMRGDGVDRFEEHYRHYCTSISRSYCTEAQHSIVWRMLRFNVFPSTRNQICPLSL